MSRILNLSDRLQLLLLLLEFGLLVGLFLGPDVRQLRDLHQRVSQALPSPEETATLDGVWAWLRDFGAFLAEITHTPCIAVVGRVRLRQVKALKGTGAFPCTHEDTQTSNMPFPEKTTLSPSLWVHHQGLGLPTFQGTFCPVQDQGFYVDLFQSRRVTLKTPPGVTNNSKVSVHAASGEPPGTEEPKGETLICPGTYLSELQHELERTRWIDRTTRFLSIHATLYDFRGAQYVSVEVDWENLIKNRWWGSGSVSLAQKKSPGVHSRTSHLALALVLTATLSLLLQLHRTLFQIRRVLKNNKRSGTESLEEVSHAAPPSSGSTIPDSTPGSASLVSIPLSSMDTTPSSTSTEPKVFPVFNWMNTRMHQLWEFLQKIAVDLIRSVLLIVLLAAAATLVASLRGEAEVFGDVDRGLKAIPPIKLCTDEEACGCREIDPEEEHEDSPGEGKTSSEREVSEGLSPVQGLAVQDHHYEGIGPLLQLSKRQRTARILVTVTLLALLVVSPWLPCKTWSITMRVFHRAVRKLAQYFFPMTILILMFAFIAFCRLGAHAEGYRTVTKSISSMVLLAFGEVDHQDFTPRGKLFGLGVFVFFVIVVFLVMEYILGAFFGAVEEVADALKDQNGGGGGRPSPGSQGRRTESSSSRD